jgi:hypothetical protein
LLFCLFYMCSTRSLLCLSPGSGFTYFLLTVTQPRLPAKFKKCSTPTCKKENFDRQSNNLLLLRCSPQFVEYFLCISLKRSNKSESRKEGKILIHRHWQTERETDRLKKKRLKNAERNRERIEKMATLVLCWQKYLRIILFYLEQNK